MLLIKLSSQLTRQKIDTTYYCFSDQGCMRFKEEIHVCARTVGYVDH